MSEAAPIDNGCPCTWCRLKWADHDGKIYGWWKVQHAWNKVIEGRVRFIEVRVFLICGIGSLVGSGAGAAIVVWLLK